MSGAPQTSISEKPAVFPRSKEEDEPGPQRRLPDLWQKPAVTIAIPTYRRPIDLEKAIRSCLVQCTDDGSSFEIVVVDNSPERSAQPIVDSIDAGDVTLRYAP